MKRLQFRHHINTFPTRDLALQYFSDITDKTKVASIEFGDSLYAEPMVAKYIDNFGKEQVILAIGVNGDSTPYHLIDSKYIWENIEINVNTIQKEIERSGNEDKRLEENINNEVKRAQEKEEKLQQQISDNIVKVELVEPSGANVLEEYSLKNAKGEVLGNNIKIYKDTSLVGAKVGYKGATSVIKNEDGTLELKYSEEHDESIEYLYLIYTNQNGELQLVGIDFESFVLEAEFGDGIKVVNHVASIKIKDGEKYLKTDKDGLYTINIENTIKETVDNASNELNIKIDTEIERSSKADVEITNIINNFSASVITEVSRLDTAIINEMNRAIIDVNNEKTEREAHILSLSAATVSELKRIDNSILTLQEDSTKVILNLSGSVISEIERINKNVSDETNRALSAEANIITSLQEENNRAIEEETKLSKAITDLNKEVKSNKVSSKDIVVEKTEEGTMLSIQVDGKTITKVADAQGIYDTNVAVLGTLINVKKVTPTSNLVKSRYELQDGDGKLLGDAIELPIESALISVKQGKEGDAIDPLTGAYVAEGTGDITMNFVYRLENGSYELMQIVVSEYFTDAHFGRGLNNQDGNISLLEGDGCEKYLVIGEDTISIIGVDDAIQKSKDEVITLLNNEVAKLNLKISNLEDKVTRLENRINELEESLEGRIFEILSNKVVGVNKEIKVTPINGTLNIGFADDAIFGKQ